MKNNLNSGVLGPINFIQMTFCSTCASDSDCIHVQENEMFSVHYVSGFPIMTIPTSLLVSRSVLPYIRI